MKNAVLKFEEQDRCIRAESIITILLIELLYTNHLANARPCSHVAQNFVCFATKPVNY